MSVNSKMTALADEVRELSGTSAAKSIDAMTTDVGNANDEIAEQMDLISQITTALEGKAGGGGVTLPSLSNPASASDILSGKEAIDGTGNKMTGTIVIKTSSNLTASEATVTVPAGYYASQATKSVNTATQATPSVSIDANGKITASATQTAGYVSAGTKTGTKQLTTQAAKTVTPSLSSQTAVSTGVYTTGTVTVNPIPSDYIVTEEIAAQDGLIAQIQSALQGKASGGSSGNLEMCTIELRCQSQDIFDSSAVYYTDGSSNLKTTLFPSSMNTSTSITVQKYSLLGVYDVSVQECSDTLTWVTGSASMRLLYVTGDGYITALNNM